MVAQWDRLYFSYFPPGSESLSDLFKVIGKVKNGIVGTHLLLFTPNHAF